MAVRSYKRRPYPTVPSESASNPHHNLMPSTGIPDRLLVFQWWATCTTRTRCSQRTSAKSRRRGINSLNVKRTSKRGPFDYKQARFPVWWGPSREAPDQTCDYMYPSCNEVIDEARITLQHS